MMLMTDYKKKKPEYREILFSKTMALDKRNPNAAYLIKNVNSGQQGFYPANEFVNDITLAVGETIVYADANIIISNTGTDTKIYNGSGSLKDTIVGSEANDVVLGNDHYHLIADDKTIYKVSATTSWSGNYYLNIGTTATECDIAVFDGLHYFYLDDTYIYKQLKSVAHTTAFDGLSGTPEFVDFIGEQMYWSNRVGLNCNIYFWSKEDPSIADKSILEKNMRPLGLGTVDGTVVLVKGIGDRTNSKEKKGRIVVSNYDGENFVEINSIKAGDEQIAVGGKIGIGNGIMTIPIVGNDDSHNTTLYHDWLLKIYSDGRIQTLDYNDTVSIDGSFVDYDTVFYWIENALYSNADDSDNYDDYDDYRKSEYITNLLHNSSNTHEFAAIGVSFEKLFEQLATNVGERLYIDFRASERDEWTLLHEVNVEKVKNYVADKYTQSLINAEYNSDVLGMSRQAYVITKMPDGSELPRFNEFQFRLRSWQGFSVIKMWYYYNYLIRNTYV